MDGARVIFGLWRVPIRHIETRSVTKGLKWPVFETSSENEVIFCSFGSFLPRAWKIDRPNSPKVQLSNCLNPFIAANSIASVPGKSDRECPLSHPLGVLSLRPKASICSDRPVSFGDQTQNLISPIFARLIFPSAN